MKYDKQRSFYDDVYYRDAINSSVLVPRHLRQLAGRLGITKGQKVLDIACGTGAWLRAVEDRGAKGAGIDISKVAFNICQRVLPDADLHCGTAESLPWSDNEFDVVSCLGSLEHFLDAPAALREMVRVAKPGAIILILVPNADFLTRKLGLYSGTNQVVLREDVRSLAAWKQLFECAGLSVVERWRDLHVLSWSWIVKGAWYYWPVRMIQAAILPFWPLAWQYQVYHLCRTPSSVNLQIENSLE